MLILINFAEYCDSSNFFLIDTVRTVFLPLLEGVLKSLLEAGEITGPVLSFYLPCFINLPTHVRNNVTFRDHSFVAPLSRVHHCIYKNFLVVVKKHHELN